MKNFWKAITHIDSEFQYLKIKFDAKLKADPIVI